MSSSDSKKKVLRRYTAQPKSPFDTYGMKARLSKADMDALEIPFGGLIEITGENGVRVFARCLPMYPTDEEKFHNKIQVDNAIKFNLGMRGPEMIMRPHEEAEVTVRKVDSPPSYAEKVTFKPVIVPIAGKFIHPSWLVYALEEKPLWEGCVIVVPIQDKESPLKVISVEPKTKEGVAIATARTSMTILYDEKVPLLLHLHHLTLDINFDKYVTDYEQFSQFLVKRGFEQQKEEPRRTSQAYRGPGYQLQPAGFYFTTLPSARPPQLVRGSLNISISPFPEERFGKVISMNFFSPQAHLQEESEDREAN